MTPSVGRIVHYVDERGDHLAAIVVRVNSITDSATVNLTVFGDMPGQTQGRHSVPHDEEHKASGSWHFPERVD